MSDAAQTDVTPEDNDQALEKVLNQDEIESLLSVQGGEVAGVEFLINNTKISHERLPMLEAVFERLSSQLSAKLRQFCGCTVDVIAQDADSVRFGEYLQTIVPPTLINVFKFKEWDRHGLLILKSDLTLTIIDILLGGRQESAIELGQERVFTAIERNLARDFTKIILDELTTTFSAIEPVTFQYERTETNPKFAGIVRPTDAAMLIPFLLSFEGRPAHCIFCIPYASIEPVREKVSQAFTGEAAGDDNLWGGHLAEEVWDAEVSMDAILGTTTVKLGEALRWKKGSVLPLRTKPHSTIDLVVKDLKTVSGKMGKRDGLVSIKVEQNWVKEKVGSHES